MYQNQYTVREHMYKYSRQMYVGESIYFAMWLIYCKIKIVSQFILKLDS